MRCFILPQNGGVDRAMHSASGNYSPQIAVGSSDTPKQPCTPKRHVSSCPTGGELLDSFTRRLICQFLKDSVAQSDPRWNESKELSTMRRVVRGLVEKHRYVYNGIMNELSLDNGVDDVAFVSHWAASIFGDGRSNWGRVASLLAFGAVVCRRLKETGRVDSVELVGQEISTYLLTVQRDWIIKNNSWDGFVERFEVADPERTIRNALIVFVVFAGAIALFIR